LNQARLTHYGFASLLSGRATIVGLQIGLAF